MKNEDLVAIAVHLPIMSKNMGKINTIGIASPEKEFGVVKEIFKESEIVSIFENEWNFKNTSNHTFDLLILCNTMMCAAEPDVWFKNLFASCKFLFVQDIIRGWRGENSELAKETGDVMRYSLPPLYLPRISTGFNLTIYNDRLHHFLTYETNGASLDLMSLHFLALFKGDLE